MPDQANPTQSSPPVLTGFSLTVEADQSILLRERETGHLIGMVTLVQQRGKRSVIRLSFPANVHIVGPHQQKKELA